MEAIDPKQRPVQSLDWGALKWLVTPDDTPEAGLTFGEVVLLPGKGHERHQEFADRVVDFDDRVIVGEELRSMGMPR